MREFHLIEEKNYIYSTDLNTFEKLNWKYLKLFIKRMFVRGKSKFSIFHAFWIRLIFKISSVSSEQFSYDFLQDSNLLHTTPRFNSKSFIISTKYHHRFKNKVKNLISHRFYNRQKKHSFTFKQNSGNYCVSLNFPFNFFFECNRFSLFSVRNHSK